MEQDHCTLAYRGFKFAEALWEYLRWRANLEDVKEPPTTVMSVLLKIWRSGGVLLSAMLIYAVLGVGSSVLTLAMVEAQEYEQAADSKDLQVLDGSVQTRKADKLVNGMPVFPWTFLSVYTSDSGLKLLERSSATLALIYYSLLATLLLTGDALLDLRGSISRALLFAAISAVLAPLRVLCTQSIVSVNPAGKVAGPLRHLDSRWRTLLLPSVLYAGAQAMTVLATSNAISDLSQTEMHWDLPTALRILVVPATAAALAVCALLPSSINLTRVEAALLPADEKTVVSVDRSAASAGSEEHASVYAAYLAPSIRAARTINVQVLWRVGWQYLKWIAALLAAVSVHAW